MPHLLIYKPSQGDLRAGNILLKYPYSVVFSIIQMDWPLHIKHIHHLRGKEHL